MVATFEALYTETYLQYHREGLGQCLMEAQPILGW